MEKITNLNNKPSLKREGGGKTKSSKNLRKKINVRLSKLKFEELKENNLLKIKIQKDKE